MNDATTTLRALADAVDECLRLACTHTDGVLPCLIDQRDALAGALPGPDRRDSAPALRTMADTVEALESDRDTPRAACAAAIDALPRGWERDAVALRAILSGERQGCGGTWSTDQR